MHVFHPRSVPQVLRPLVLLTLLGLLVPLLLPFQRLAPPTALPEVPTAADAAATLAQLPLAFVPNAGQTDPTVRFEARALGGTLFFTPAAVILALPTATPAEGHDNHQEIRCYLSIDDLEDSHGVLLRLRRHDSTCPHCGVDSFRRAYDLWCCDA
jgi:hypothetical protein